MIYIGFGSGIFPPLNSATKLARPEKSSSTENPVSSKNYLIRAPNFTKKNQASQGIQALTVNMIYLKWKHQKEDSNY